MSDTLKEGEPHPMALTALEDWMALSLQEKMQHLEACSSCALEGNRLGEVCAGTIRRLMNGERVSDRYLLGLMYFIKLKGVK